MKRKRSVNNCRRKEKVAFNKDLVEGDYINGAHAKTLDRYKKKVSLASNNNDERTAYALHF